MHRVSPCWHVTSRDPSRLKRGAVADVGLNFDQVDLMLPGMLFDLLSYSEALFRADFDQTMLA